MQYSPKAKQRNSIKHTCKLLLTITARVVKSWVALTVSTENGTNKQRTCCSRHWLQWQGQRFTAHDFTAMQLWDSSAMQLLTGIILFHIAHTAISKFVSWIFVLLGLFTSFTETTLHSTQIKQWSTDRLHESLRVMASIPSFFSPNSESKDHSWPIDSHSTLNLLILFLCRHGVLHRTLLDSCHRIHSLPFMGKQGWKLWLETHTLKAQGDSAGHHVGESHNSSRQGIT